MDGMTRDEMIANLALVSGRLDYAAPADLRGMVEDVIAALRDEAPATKRCGFVHADGWTCGRAVGHPSVHVPPSRMASPPAPAPNYVHEMAELLRSACAIAERQGVGTAWERFIESVYALGLNGVTARTYRVLPHEAPSPLGHQAGAANPMPPAPAPELVALVASKGKNHSLTATVEGGTLIVRIGINVLAQAAALSDWANPHNDGTDNHQREFAITNAPLFAKEVASALLDEREDGSSLLTDVLDKASQAAVSDGAQSCDFDDVVIVHGHFDPRETWATDTIGGEPVPDEPLKRIAEEALTLVVAKRDHDYIHGLHTRVDALRAELVALTTQAPGETCGTCAHGNDADSLLPSLNTYCTYRVGFFNGKLMPKSARCESWRAR